MLQCAQFLRLELCGTNFADIGSHQPTAGVKVSRVATTRSRNHHEPRGLEPITQRTNPIAAVAIVREESSAIFINQSSRNVELMTFIYRLYKVLTKASSIEFFSCACSVAAVCKSKHANLNSASKTSSISYNPSGVMHLFVHSCSSK